MKLCNGNTWSNTLQKQPLEVFYIKKVLLEISQNSQENTCARVSFLLRLQAFGLQLYQKRDSGKRNTFSTEHLRETASDIKFIYIENVVKLVLFVVLSWPPKIWFDRRFFYFSVLGDRPRNNIYLQCCWRSGTPGDERGEGALESDKGNIHYFHHSPYILNTISWNIELWL